MLHDASCALAPVDTSTPSGSASLAEQFRMSRCVPWPTAATAPPCTSHPRSTTRAPDEPCTRSCVSCKGRLGSTEGTLRPAASMRTPDATRLPPSFTSSAQNMAESAAREVLLLLVLLAVLLLLIIRLCRLGVLGVLWVLRALGGQGRVRLPPRRATWLPGPCTCGRVGRRCVHVSMCVIVHVHTLCPREQVAA